ncbi:hypothetical protein BDK51DRAFT_43513 [Blyttiomyces helicus]|uniref:Uncharacterized protein n=1 Tax=Blyttiomyces helicus TaxID=388810 RepID=A0A4P9WGW7_9FUNG|nr:hypothetical protein BDK51DRAFT_43513 [Blyttiomyces helicus]|eukprot:RKO90628.1 hypothetical protein BDK51DRAFT_43513 [Blyttiomyces helicus]
MRISLIIPIQLAQLHDPFVPMLLALGVLYIQDLIRRGIIVDSRPPPPTQTGHPECGGYTPTRLPDGPVPDPLRLSPDEDDKYSIIRYRRPRKGMRISESPERAADAR